MRLEHGRQGDQAGAVLVGDARGDGDGVEVGHADVVGEGAVDLAAHEAAVRAEVDAPREAEGAVAAEDHRVQDDPVADGEALRTLAEGRHDARRLVSLDDGQARGDLALVDAHVGAADGRRRDGHEHVAAGHGRTRDLLDAKLVGGAKDRRLHGLDACHLWLVACRRGRGARRPQPFSSTPRAISANSSVVSRPDFAKALSLTAMRMAIFSSALPAGRPRRSR